MRQYKTVAQFFFILSIVNFVFAAPTVRREIHAARNDMKVSVLGEDATAALEKRGNIVGGGLVVPAESGGTADEGGNVTGDEGPPPPQQQQQQQPRQEQPQPQQPQQEQQPAPAQRKSSRPRPMIMTPEKVMAVRVLAVAAIASVVIGGLIALHGSVQQPQQRDS
jgi:hypothetical protein